MEGLTVIDFNLFHSLEIIYNTKRKYIKINYLQKNYNNIRKKIFYKGNKFNKPSLMQSQHEPAIYWQHQALKLFCDI